MAKAQKKTAKSKKERAKKYDNKLKIHGTFDEVMKVSVQPMRELKKT